MLECNSPKLWIFILLILLSGCNGQWCNNGIKYGEDCFIYPSQQVPMTWSEAETYCQGNYGGHLPSIQDSNKDALVRGFISLFQSSTWIGAKEHLNTNWRWVADSRIIGPQGCYVASSASPEFPYKISVPSLRPSICAASCRLPGYKYAAVQNGSLCFCGNSYGKYGPSNGCTSPCTGDNTQFCGGPKETFVLYPGGTFAQWAKGQPDNNAVYEYCAALDVSAVGRNKSADQQCSQQYIYACDIYNSAVCTSSDIEGVYVFSNLINRCFYISNIQRSWFDARQQCILRNGDLAELNTAFQYKELAQLLSTRSNRYYWVGLNKHVLQWSTDEAIKYTNFKTGLPTDNPNGCVVMERADSYTWSDIPCTSTRNFMCQVNNKTLVPTTSTTTTTTTTTTMPTTTSTTTQSSSITTNPGVSSSSSTARTTTQPTTTTTKSTTTTKTTTRTPTTTSTITTSTTTLPPTTISTTASTITTAGSGSNPIGPTTVTATISTTGSTTDSTTSASGSNAVPIAGQSTGSTNDIVFIVVLVIICILLVLIIIVIIVIVCMRKNNAKRNTIPPKPEEIIPYGGKPDEYITSTPVFNINDSRSSLVSGETCLQNVKLSKKTHGTQTMPQHHSYTKTFRLTDDDLSADTDLSARSTKPPTGRKPIVNYLSDREHYARRHNELYVQHAHPHVRGHNGIDNNSKRHNGYFSDNNILSRGHDDSGIEDNFPRVPSRHVRHRKNSVGHSDNEDRLNKEEFTDAHVATDVRWSDIDTGPLKIRNSFRNRSLRKIYAESESEDFVADKRGKDTEKLSSPRASKSDEKPGGILSDESVEPEKKKRKTKVCPECGKKIVLLRKHLISKHHMDPGSQELKDALAQSRDNRQIEED